MGYSDINNLLNEINPDELARLTGDPSGQQINAVRIDWARVMAESIIDSYLVGRWTIGDYNPADTLLKKLSIDLTIYTLYEYAFGRSVIPNTIVWRRMNAMKMLKDLQSGYASLVSQQGEILSPPSIRSNKININRTFSNELMDQFNSED